MTARKKDQLKYWLSLFLVLASIVSMFMRIEHRLTKIEEGVCHIKDVNRTAVTNVEKRVARLEDDLKEVRNVRIIYPTRRHR